MSGGLNFDFQFRKPDSARRSGDSRMRILLLGNFRGVRPEGGGLSDPKIRKVDVDEFPALLEKLAPRLSLRLPGAEQAPLDLSFSELEDFEPDALWRSLDVFARLRDLRKRLQSPATVAAAAEEIRGPLPAPDPEPAPETGDGEEGDLDRLLGGRPAHVSGGGRGGVDVSGFIRAIVGPHIVPGPDPRQDQMVASLDQAAAELMRRILRHADFRALESAWRALWNLASGVETDESLTLHVLDLSRDEIHADLNAAGGELERWALYKAIVERGPKSPGGEPWSAIAADFEFSPSRDDVALLGALGVLAAQAGGPFLASAGPGFLGIESFAGTPDPSDWTEPEPDAALRWNALRSAPMAPFIGLAAPRLLFRLPYGPGGEEIDAFEFDEIGADRPHEAYPWGSPAFGLAKLLARSFTERGAKMEPGDHLDIEDLPAYVEPDGEGGKRMLPGAEAFLSERAGEALLAGGIMPLLSWRNRPAVRVMRMQSIAEPPTPLRGFWS